MSAAIAARYIDLMVFMAGKSLQVFVEPRQGTLLRIGKMLRIPQPMPLAWVDHAGRWHVNRLQRMQKFLRLRRGTFDIVFSDVGEGRRLHTVHEIDGRRGGIDRRIVIGGLAE